MPQYSFLACELTSGRVIAELPLTAVSAQRHLTGGQFGADLNLAGRDLERCRDLLYATAPGRTSVAVSRDGKCMGEWRITKRTRGNNYGPIKLQGAEVVSYLDRRLTVAANYAQVDQLTIARTMVRAAVAGGPGGVGAVALSVPIVTSGVLRDRRYKVAEATVGQRLRELADVNGGFDYTIETQFGSIAGAQGVIRTMQLAYPLAGIVQPFMFEQAAAGRRGGNIAAFAMDEDASALASQFWAIGAGEDADQVLGTASNLTLTAAGYPYMQGSGSWSSVSVQATIDGYARAGVDLAQIVEVPPTVTVLADGSPALGDYQLGDRCAFNVESSPQFPDGYVTAARILGWTLRPPTAGPEVVDLEITSFTDAPGD